MDSRDNNNETYFEKYNKCDVFTPDDISKLMSSKIQRHGTLLDPSVGTGNLLKFVCTEKYDIIDVYEIKKCYMDKVPDMPNIRKHLCDFLMSSFEREYTNIIMNPPYIRIQDIPRSYVQKLREKWCDVFEKGSIDMYHAFIMKCIELLSDDGVMVCITPNSYLHTKSSKKFREFLFKNALVKEIIDFRDKHVFENASVYCCITVISKCPKTEFVYNDKIVAYSSINHPMNQTFLIHSYSYSDTSDISGKQTLKDRARIYNGIATLRDRIFIHDKKIYNEDCWREIFVSTKIKYCIYPYDENGKIICEEIFQKTNPETYCYLVSQKSELAMRDNQKGSYPAWYAYGRSQSLVVSKSPKVIYIPTLIDPKNVSFNVIPPILHASCLCIEPNDIDDIPLIIECILKNISYIQQNSTVRNNGWINISSTILKEIPFR